MSMAGGKRLTMGQPAAKKAKAPRMRRKFLLTDKAIPVGRDIFTEQISSFQMLAWLPFFGRQSLCNYSLAQLAGKSMKVAAHQ